MADHVANADPNEAVDHRRHRPAVQIGRACRRRGAPFALVLGLLLVLAVAMPPTASGQIGPRATDPWIVRAKLVASDPNPPVPPGTARNLGYSVGISGTTVIAGAPYDDERAQDAGAAYVFIVNATTGQWAQQAKLLASDAQATDQIGVSVAVSGDTAIVGAPFDDDRATDAGGAYVFVRNPATGAWSQQQKLTAVDGVANAGMGIAVAIAGDTALIGAPATLSQGALAGAVYVFTRNGLSWSQQTKLLASDTQAGDNFGVSVAFSNERAVVGASLMDNERGANAGAAYVFGRSGTTWSPQGRLLGNDTAAGDRFGFSVALDGDTALVGAPSDDDKRLESGTAFVFVRDPGPNTWSQQAKLDSVDNSTSPSGIGLGTSVTLSGHRAIAGAPGRFRAVDAEGSAFTWERNPGTGAWREVHQLTPAGPTGQFGLAVAMAGDAIVVGAPHDAVNGGHAGSAYVFQYLGRNGRTQADFDGDGKADVGVWSPTHGLWFVLPSAGGGPLRNVMGSNGQVPVPADYDGDRKADYAVFVPSNGVWFIQPSGGGPPINTALGAVGPNQVPVPADYDGDGRADLAVWVPGNGFFLVQKSSGGFMSNIIGSASSIPIPGDYDADGKADMGVWTPASGR